MSTGVIVLTEPEVDLDASCYAQNVAAEWQSGILEDFEASHGCKLHALISDGTEGHTFLPAAEVLAEVRKMREIAESLEGEDEEHFEYGRQAFLIDITELEQAVAEAVKRDLKVALDCG